MTDNGLRGLEREVEHGDISKLPNLIHSYARIEKSLYPWLPTIVKNKEVPEVREAVSEQGLLNFTEYGTRDITATRKYLRMDNKTIPTANVLLFNALFNDYRVSEIDEANDLCKEWFGATVYEDGSYDLVAVRTDGNLLHPRYFGSSQDGSVFTYYIPEEWNLRIASSPPYDEKPIVYHSFKPEENPGNIIEEFYLGNLASEYPHSLNGDGILDRIFDSGSGKESGRLFWESWGVWVTNRQLDICKDEIRNCHIKAVDIRTQKLIGVPSPFFKLPPEP